MELFGFETERSWDYENGFYITSDITRMSKMLAHFELYKMIVNLPGAIIETGVFKGASLIRFATFRILLEFSHSRKIIGFDAFGKFPKQLLKEDDAFARHFESSAGEGISIDEIEKVFLHKKIENIELVEGNINETVPKYKKEHPELKIALLHIDTDVYEPAITALNNLYDKVVKNGLIVFDDYAAVGGETKAVDEFFSDKDILLEKLPISHGPTFIKKK